MKNLLFILTSLTIGLAEASYLTKERRQEYDLLQSNIQLATEVSNFAKDNHKNLEAQNASNLIWGSDDATAEARSKRARDLLVPCLENVHLPIDTSVKDVVSRAGNAQSKEAIFIELSKYNFQDNQVTQALAATPSALTDSEKMAQTKSYDLRILASRNLGRATGTFLRILLDDSTNYIWGADTDSVENRKVRALKLLNGITYNASVNGRKLTSEEYIEHIANKLAQAETKEKAHAILGNRLHDTERALRNLEAL